MRVYYLFKINGDFSDLYNNKMFYLYKTLEEISLSNENNIMTSFRVYEQLIDEYNKSKINSILFKNYNYDAYYKKILNKHIYDDGVEKTKLTIYNTYIKIITNRNITTFFKILKNEKNIFVCDFENKDYFWLDKVLKKTCTNY